ncbi:MAG: hypothetical protein MET45_28105 [Nostoc sp. LLA-1]|nr:hypothetical protein [Cyanocohniella sp. LLY]
MEQWQERQKLNINLKTDGELNLSGNLEDLSSEEFIVLQQLIDESQRRSKSAAQSAARVQEMMERGQTAQGIIAAIAIIMLSFIPIYGVTSYISSQIKGELINVR